MHLEPNEKRCKRRIFNKFHWTETNSTWDEGACIICDAMCQMHLAIFIMHILMKWNGMKMKKNVEESCTLFSSNTHADSCSVLVENIFYVRKSQRMRGSYLLWQWNRIYLCAVQMRENCFFFVAAIVKFRKNTVKCVNNAITFRTNAPSDARYGLSSSIFCIANILKFFSFQLLCRRYCCRLFTLIILRISFFTGNGPENNGSHWFRN